VCPTTYQSFLNPFLAGPPLTVARHIGFNSVPKSSKEAIATLGLARAARPRRRHLGLIASFVLLVLIPLDVLGYYLWGVAADRYASHVELSIQREETPAALDFLGGIAEIGGGNGADAEILRAYIEGPDIIARVDRAVDLNALLGGRGDWFFGLPDQVDSSILLTRWNRHVHVWHDPQNALIRLRVTAFAPEDAQAIATAISDEASALINHLSDQARVDSIYHAQVELNRTVERLKSARLAMMEFRTRTQIVDPAADIATRMALLSDLRQQRTDAEIELSMLQETTRTNDPRLAQAARRKSAIERRIAEEKALFGTGTGAYSAVMAEFETLQVDLEYAEKSYLSAQTALEVARARADRQTRYLTPYVGPTRADTAEFPSRWPIMGLAGAALILGWAVLALVYYSLRDRR